MQNQISTKDMSREDWLKYRQTGIGGSDAGAICGLNPYKSPVEVWVDKTSDAPVKKEDNEAMRIGRDLEQYVAERFTEATGKKVRRKNAIIRDETDPFLIANVDRVIVGENALLECKTASPYSAGKWDDGKCPESYEIQCHHYMMVTGAKKVYLACLIFGRRFVIVEIDRDEDVIRNLRSIETDFWNKYVITGQMPPPDGSDSAGEIIKGMSPEAMAGSVMTLPDMGAEIARYDEISALMDTLKTEKESIKQKFMLAMDDTETAFVEDRKITWKETSPRITVDHKEIKAKDPKLYKKLVEKGYLKKGKASRVFRIW